MNTENGSPARNPAPGRIRRAAVFVCALILAVVFVRAAWPKIADPHAFAIMVYRYQFLPDSFINSVALVVPWLEVVCAAALLTLPPFRHAAAWLTTLLLVGFTILIASALARGITDISCGCFSVAVEGEHHIGWVNIARNLVLLSLAAVAVWGTRPPAPE